MASDPVVIHVQSVGLKELFAACKAAEGNLQVELRRGAREAGAAAVEAVKAGSSWSSRIPAAVKAQPFFTAKRAGLRIVVDGRKAPEGAPLEHDGNAGDFRHPVYGRSWWVSQPARPFFYNSIEGAGAVDAAMLAVMARVEAKLLA